MSFARNEHRGEACNSTSRPRALREEPMDDNSLNQSHLSEEKRLFVKPHDGEITAQTQRRPSRVRHRSPWVVLAFIILITLGALGLTTMMLGFANVPNVDLVSDHYESTETHHDEFMPERPRIRDPSEYILDLSWDFQAEPTTREYNWTILDAELNPDGIYRPMILINNQFPGPLVECNDGDTLAVHVHNQATNATSIHFHGLFQNGTNAMDGTVGVTQCPIAPNTSFTYRFTVTKQSGTYWYHAHQSGQASDGLLGPMVVHTAEERKSLQELDYDTDRIVMIQDHYHNLTSEILMDYLKPGMENDEPVPDNGLINGRGTRKCEDFPGWQCDDTNTSFPVFDLAPGQRHRLRIINVGAFAEFQVQFDEHPFYVTEVDGTDVHPEPFHRLNILPAQRYSIVLETNVTSTNQNTFWMRARMVTHCFTTRNKFLKAEVRGVIRYSNDTDKSTAASPTSKEWPDAVDVICKDLDTTALHPVIHQDLAVADNFVYLRANFEIGAWRLARGFFNESTWHTNTTRPSLYRFLEAAHESPDSMILKEPLRKNDAVFNPANELVLQTRGIRTVDIAINNFDDGAHPFHLHGHKFFVLAHDKDGYPPSEADLPDYLAEHGQMQNPLRRDTVTVQGYKWAIIRVVLDNPGLWTFHCHNLWHAESGMVMQFLVRSEEVAKWEVDEQAKAMCEMDGVDTGMRPDDSIWFGFD